MPLVRGLIWVFRTVIERAEQVFYDEEAVKAQLATLYDELDRGTVTEAEFARQEDELLQRLAEIEDHEEDKRRRR
jgi:hypothetical protein